MEVLSMDVAKLQGNTATVTKKVQETTIKSDAESIGGQGSAQEANSYYKYDSIELSQDYLEYKTKSENSSVESDTNLQNAASPQGKPAEIPSQTSAETTSTAVGGDVSVSQETVSSDSASTSASSDDLSSYSDSELKSLKDAGRITVAQYDSEIASRKISTQTAAAQTVVSQTNDTQKQTPQMQNTQTQSNQTKSTVANPSIL
ncbi:hypothetical protein GH810_11730 [Acetobacterium paludosum]|uniref:Uncharacterized protein n=1 Tax=Acetobacterium paludosum TaxID=52693 RepID=A0A923HUU8_9FIRM|nr:hypothetical protein [Acetobacterium paludosum]MBC3888983.1 hypothetical protein [Acetobacterium paludosum]